MLVSFLYFFNLDYGQLMEGTPLDLALNLGCDMFSSLCKATSDNIKSSEDNPGWYQSSGTRFTDLGRLNHYRGLCRSSLLVPESYTAKKAQVSTSLLKSCNKL